MKIYGNKGLAIEGALVAALCGLISCTSEGEPASLPKEGQIQEGENCKVVLNIGFADGFEGETRGQAREWEDGDCVWFSLKTDNGYFPLKASYNADEGEWKATYEGSLPVGKYDSQSLFAEGDCRRSGHSLALGATTALFLDERARVEKTDRTISLTATLRPLTGRLRFQGAMQCDFTVSGIVTRSEVSLADMKFETDSSPLECRTGEDGWTEYLYGDMPSESRSLSIAYDNLFFTATFSERIMAPGKTGYIALPTREAHTGWTMTELAAPELAAVAVSEVGTSGATLSCRLLSDGNGDVSECGFCYSLSGEPTTADAKATCTLQADGRFAKSLTGLPDNTTWHVRAYARNQTGLAYSEEVVFTTIAITTPAVSAAKVTIEDRSTTAQVVAELLSAGNGEVSECGFCWSESPAPDLDSKVVHSSLPQGSQLSFSATLSNLTIGKRYYLRAYARNQKGTGYGPEVSFIGGGGKPDSGDNPSPDL